MMYITYISIAKFLNFIALTKAPALKFENLCNPLLEEGEYICI